MKTVNLDKINYPYKFYQREKSDGSEKLAIENVDLEKYWIYQILELKEEFENCGEESKREEIKNRIIDLAGKFYQENKEIYDYIVVTLLLNSNREENDFLRLDSKEKQSFDNLPFSKIKKEYREGENKKQVAINIYNYIIDLLQRIQKILSEEEIVDQLIIKKIFEEINSIHYFLSQNKDDDFLSLISYFSHDAKNKAGNFLVYRYFTKFFEPYKESFIKTQFDKAETIEDIFPEAVISKIKGVFLSIPLNINGINIKRNGKVSEKNILFHEKIFNIIIQELIENFSKYGQEGTDNLQINFNESNWQIIFENITAKKSEAISSNQGIRKHIEACIKKFGGKIILPKYSVEFKDGDRFVFQADMPYQE